MRSELPGKLSSINLKESWAGEFVGGVDSAEGDEPVCDGSFFFEQDDIRAMDRMLMTNAETSFLKISKLKIL
ncbi:MAG: hypothetical protein FJ112_12070 [Deltaproteobacteria bacterium]|nr:hypothetical protein [Deltaproteobacteria bacterium]